MVMRLHYVYIQETIQGYIISWRGTLISIPLSGGSFCSSRSWLTLNRDEWFLLSFFFPPRGVIFTLLNSAAVGGPEFFFWRYIWLFDENYICCGRVKCSHTANKLGDSYRGVINLGDFSQKRHVHTVLFIEWHTHITTVLWLWPKYTPDYNILGEILVINSF